MSNLYNIIHPANHLTSVSYDVAGTVGFVGNMFLIYLLFKEYKNLKPYELIITKIMPNNKAIKFLNWFTFHSQ